MAAQPLFPSAVWEKGRAAIVWNPRTPRRLFSRLFSRKCVNLAPDFGMGGGRFLSHRDHRGNTEDTEIKPPWFYSVTSVSPPCPLWRRSSSVAAVPHCDVRQSSGRPVKRLLGISHANPSPFMVSRPENRNSICGRGELPPREITRKTTLVSTKKQTCSAGSTSAPHGYASCSACRRAVRSPG